MACLILSFFVFGSNGAFASQFNLIGVGTASCGTWTVDQRDPKSWPALADESWVLGFLSGIGFESLADNPLNGTDANGVVGWIDNYCAANPLSQIFDATKAFDHAHPN
jgi:hypothetical protein